MTIILMQIANGTKQEIDEHTPINDIIKKLGPKAKKAKFFGPGSRELKVFECIVSIIF